MKISIIYHGKNSILFIKEEGNNIIIFYLNVCEERNEYFIIKSINNK